MRLRRVAVGKQKVRTDDDWQGLHELICSADCVRGQGEAGVTHHRSHTNRLSFISSNHFLRKVFLLSGQLLSLDFTGFATFDSQFPVNLR